MAPSSAGGLSSALVSSRHERALDVSRSAPAPSSPVFSHTRMQAERPASGRPLQNAPRCVRRPAGGFARRQLNQLAPAQIIIVSDRMEPAHVRARSRRGARAGHLLECAPAGVSVLRGPLNADRLSLVACRLSLVVRRAPRAMRRLSFVVCCLSSVVCRLSFVVCVCRLRLSFVAGARRASERAPARQLVNARTRTKGVTLHGSRRPAGRRISPALKPKSISDSRRAASGPQLARHSPDCLANDYLSEAIAGRRVQAGSGRQHNRG